jgi:hypothetical protein
VRQLYQPGLLLLTDVDHSRGDPLQVRADHVEHLGRPRHDEGALPPTGRRRGLPDTATGPRSGLGVQALKLTSTTTSVGNWRFRTTMKRQPWALWSIRAHEDQRDHPPVRTGRLETEARVSGSHRHFAHPAKPGLVTVAGKPSATLKPKTESSILKQAGLRKERP